MSSLSNNIDNLRFKAEKFRDKNAQFELGSKHLQGDGVDRDLDEARKWLLMAQENGHPEAAEVLNRMRGSVDDSKGDFFNEIERLIETGADLNAREDASLHLQRHRITSLIAQRFEVNAATSFKQQARNDVSNQKPVNSSKSGCSTVFLFAGVILMMCGYLLS